MSENAKVRPGGRTSIFDLDSIRLVECAARTGIRSPSELGGAGTQIGIGVKTKTELEPGGGVVRVLVATEVSIRASASEEQPRVEVKAIYEVRFSLLHEPGGSEADLDKRAGIEGRNIAWPYIRELVQSALVRMGLPPLTLPLLLPRQRREGPPASTEADAGPKAAEAPAE